MSKLPVGVLLAAGQSHRFGSNKLLHPVIDDTPMLLASAQNLASVLPDSIAVIHPDMIYFTKQLQHLGMRVVINEQATQGIGSSIACAVTASQDATGWLIALADMPFIKNETIRLLANKLKDADIVAPMFNEQRGHPVGFRHCYKTELLNLNKDIGARHIIKEHQDKLELLLTDDAGILKDIDYPKDINN